MLHNSVPLTTTEVRSWLTSPIVIVLAATILRVTVLYVFEGTIHDGTSRVFTAWEWVFDGRAIFGRTLWPEGNYLLPALALLVWNDPYWSIRVLYALVGVSNVWFVYLLGTSVYGRSAGAVAGWIIALMPFHILVSGEGAMSEGPYISFILLAVLAIVRYSTKPGAWLAAAAGLALTLASMFRIDGVMWGIPLALSIAIAAFDRRIAPSLALRDLVLFGVCGLLFPVVLFSQWLVLFPDPFHILNEAKFNTEQFFVNGKHPRWPGLLYEFYVVAFWPGSTFVLLTPIVALVGWLGVVSAILERKRSATPLVLGLCVICAWLAYAAFTQSIQTQWRYTLVLMVMLAVFALPGARALTRYYHGLTFRQLGIACALVAILCQGLITYVTFVDYGTLSRQLGVLSPIRPNQFGSRELLSWINVDSSGSRVVLLTPHVMESPYLLLQRKGLERSGRIVVQSYYLNNNLVHTRASLTDELMIKLSSARFVATSTGLRELGLRDGLVRELIQPVRDVEGTYAWRSVRLRYIQQFGSNILWEVVRPSHIARPDA